MSSVRSEDAKRFHDSFIAAAAPPLTNTIVYPRRWGVRTQLDMTVGIWLAQMTTPSPNGGMLRTPSTIRVEQNGHTLYTVTPSGVEHEPESESDEDDDLPDLELIPRERTCKTDRKYKLTKS